MSFLNRIFRRNMVDCPRCLGKGEVDLEDIKRLKKELVWAPGKCAYCNDVGKVPPDRVDKISADLAYLTTELPSWERHKVINGDEKALERAKEFDELIQNFIEEIENLYYLGNKEPDEIAEYLFEKQDQYRYSDSDKQETVSYIERVINSKLKG